MAPVNEQPVEENLPSILYQEQIQRLINSMEIDTQDSYLEELQAASEESRNSEPQIGQNFEKVRFFIKYKNTMKRI
jgi:hypothetical protein